MEKTKTVIYLDGLSHAHHALVTSVNQLHEGMVTLVYVDVNAPEADNVRKVWDVPHISLDVRQEPNPDLPDYRVNVWMEPYEHYQPLPADHPAFDHPFLEPKLDEQGNRILPERPQTQADLDAHHAIHREPDVSAMLDAAPPAPPEPPPTSAPPDPPPPPPTSEPST